MAAAAFLAFLGACATPEPVPEPIARCWGSSGGTPWAAFRDEMLARYAPLRDGGLQYVKDPEGFIGRLNQDEPVTSYPVPDLIAYAFDPSRATVAIWVVMNGCVVQSVMIPASVFLGYTGMGVSPIRTAPRKDGAIQI